MTKTIIKLAALIGFLCGIPLLISGVWNGITGDMALGIIFIIINGTALLVIKVSED